MQTIPNQQLYTQGVKAYNVPYITPTDRIIEQNYVKVEKPIVLNSVTFFKNPPIIKRNISIKKYNKSPHLNTVGQNYNIINPSIINQRNSYTFYDKTNNLFNPNINGQKIFQRQTYINPVVNNISYADNNVITSNKNPTYVNNDNLLNIKENLVMKKINNISLVPNYITNVKPLTTNNININQNIITPFNEPN